ncbi:aminomethyltransferase [Histoplasma ohiense]|nr:aminomethyltransferase [Histoplasma ohiense (nom. inval.)]
MSETKMRLEDWLDDLCVRFIINLPREELESVERICFQVEEAQWFYEDFIRPLDPNLPSLSLRAFALRIFQHCPLMSQWSHYHHSTAFSEFLAYKTRVPVRGAILLNQDMDEVVLVKGWKKNANWSFPRGKINKDEKDLDCAIREVYEETGFDIKAAGLVKDEKKMKYIEIPMREQNMRLYVLRDVPRNTIFEPRTRKEISKIEWYKLSELPTLKKSKQIETNGHNLSNKFYMVAPFLGPLKKWIAQQKRADLAATQNTDSNVQETSGNGLLVEEDEGLSANEPSPKEDTNEVQLPSDLPEVSTLEDPSVHLKRLLNINSVSSLPEVSTDNQLQKTDLSKGSELLALLRKASDVNVDKPRSTAIARPTQSMYPSQGILHQQSQHQDIAPQPHFTQPSVPQHQSRTTLPLGTKMPMGQDHFRNVPHPRQVGQYPTFPFPYPTGHPLHGHQLQPSQPGLRHFPYPSFPASPGAPYSGKQLPAFPHLPRPPFGIQPVSSALNQTPPFNTTLPQRNAPAPYQRTGDPDFAQELFPNLHAPSIPPASKLPPPKLTSHSLALLNVFKNCSVKKEDVAKPELSSSQSAAPRPNHAQSQHHENLLGLLKKPQAPPPVPGHVELAAQPSPSSDPARVHLSGASQSQPRTQTPRKSTNGVARTSATVSGPLNIPQFEAIAKPVPNKAARQSPRNIGKGEATPPKGNFVILPRPPPAKDAVPPQPANAKPPPSSSPRRNVKFSEITKPFQPKILRRPVKEDLQASLPNGTVTVSAFTLSEKATVSDHPRGNSVQTNADYDRRLSRTASQKEALLSLFGKVSPSPPPVSVEQSRSSPPAPKSPPRSAIISPVDLSSPKVGMRTAHGPAPLSTGGSISPIGGIDTRKAAPTSPSNKAFLLGYLDNIAKGKH